MDNILDADSARRVVTSVPYDKRLKNGVRHILEALNKMIHKNVRQWRQ
jgi:hypothetical protein